jgi:hypothetical protein
MNKNTTSGIQKNTIDEIHTEILIKIYKTEKEKLPQLMEKKSHLQNHLKNLSEDQIDEYMAGHIDQVTNQSQNFSRECNLGFPSVLSSVL